VVGIYEFHSSEYSISLMMCQGVRNVCVILSVGSPLREGEKQPQNQRREENRTVSLSTNQMNLITQFAASPLIIEVNYQMVKGIIREGVFKDGLKMIMDNESIGSIAILWQKYFGNILFKFIGIRLRAIYLNQESAQSQNQNVQERMFTMEAFQYLSNRYEHCFERVVVVREDAVNSTKRHEILHDVFRFLMKEDKNTLDSLVEGIAAHFGNDGRYMSTFRDISKYLGAFHYFYNSDYERQQLAYKMLPEFIGYFFLFENLILYRQFCGHYRTFISVFIILRRPPIKSHAVDE